MRYAKQCKMIRRCGGCGKKMVFFCFGKFRVNANGRRLDVWLIYRCQRCGHTWNIPLYERISPEKLSPELYEGLLDNDPELVRRYAGDRGFFKGKGYELVKP